MSVQVRRRREAATFLSTFVGAQGELLVDTTNNRVQVHDGATPGGWPAARLTDLPSSTSPLALTQGGTGITAASPNALLAGLGAIGRTAVADSSYTALASDRTIAFTALSSARTVILPAASAFPTGTALTILDESGACSATNIVSIARVGTDTINGASAVTISTPFGYVALESNGTAKWTVIDSVIVSSGSSAAAASSLTGAMLAGNVIASSLTSVGTLVGGATGTGFTIALGTSALTGTVPIANGGTSATTASSARAALAAAASGSNADITSLAGLTTALSVAQGGTGATAGLAAATSLGLVGRTVANDTSITATAASRTIAFTAISAARVVTLPSASAFPTGTTLLIVDETGACSSNNTITVACGGSDKLNGAASAALIQPFGYVALNSNGSNTWTIIDQSTASMGQQSAASVNIVGGAINATAIGVTTPAAVAATALSASGLVTLPANSLSLATQAQAPPTTLRGNLTGTTANVVDSTLTAHLDAAFGTSVGQLLYRGPSSWTALSPGASGFVLTSNGSGAAPTYQAGGGSGGVSTPRSSVRQTVQGGPTASGAPSFLPATSSGLSITGQNISATVPLVVAAAQGSGATGQNDFVYALTSNPTWSGLPANATSFLFVNASNGALSSSTLPPTYVFGANLSAAATIVSGQFTFDYCAMAGYLGGGSAAVATPLVCVGQVTTSATSVTTVAAYAFNGYWESAVLTTVPAAATSISYSSNLGIAGVTSFDFSFQAASGGFAANEKIMGIQVYDGYGYPMVFTTATLLTGSFTTSVSNGSPLYYRNKTTGAIAGLTAGTTGVNIKLIQRRGWGGA